VADRAPPWGAEGEEAKLHVGMFATIWLFADSR
jgi:hypothetical protein